jgi:hypothetical protein
LESTNGRRYGALTPLLPLSRAEKCPRKPAQTDLQQESRFGKTEAEKEKLKAAAEHGGGHTPPAAPPSLSLPAAMSNASSLALYYYRCCWLAASKKNPNASAAS